MSLRNGDHGYGAVTTLLHWLTAGALGGQSAVGYAIRGELDDHCPSRSC